MGYYLPTWKASKINYIVDNHTMDLPPRMRIHNHISPNLECCECYISGSMPVDAASHESDLQTICWYLSSQLMEIQGVSNVELFFLATPPRCCQLFSKRWHQSNQRLRYVMDTLFFWNLHEGVSVKCMTNKYKTTPHFNAVPGKV